MTRRVRLACLAVLVAAGACSIEHAPAGRPGAANPAADSAASAEVYAALRLYYTRLTARDWKVLALSFWPRATITHIRTGAAGSGGAGAGEPGQVETATIEEVIREAEAMKDCPASFAAEMTRATVVTYGPLADAWVTYRFHCGVARDSVTTRYGIDSFHLLRHAGDWRIAGLTFTHEVAGLPLSRP